MAHSLPGGPDTSLHKQLPQARTPHEQTALERRIKAAFQQMASNGFDKKLLFALAIIGESEHCLNLKSITGNTSRVYPLFRQRITAHLRHGCFAKAWLYRG